MAVLDPVITGFTGFYRGYLRLFAESSLADRLSPPHPVRHTGFEFEVEVRERVDVAAGVVALTLARPDGRSLPRWTPGAHLDVILASGTERQYSLCGHPDDRSSYRISVRLVADGGGGSREVHETVHPGDRLMVRGPRQAFPLVEEPDYLFVAGGIGITPILPMIAAAEAAGSRWRAVVVGRDRASMPFAEDLLRLGEHCVDIWPDDECGLPDVEKIASLAAPGAAVYVCGPPPLMDGVRAAVAAKDREARVYCERFSAPPVAGGVPFTVSLARTGRRVSVDADESMLAALRREVPGVTYSCQQGFCGTCRQRVVSGEVEHRDTLLTPAERAANLILPCLSRAQGTLVLDL